MKIWVCIPVFNRIEYTLKCLNSLHEQAYKDYTIVVCDHGSTDGTSQAIRSNYPDAVVLEKGEDLWWTGAINCCIEYALKAGRSGKDLILTLNNDLVVDPDYLSVLVDAHERHPHSLITSVGYDSARRLVAPGFRLSWVTSKVKTLDPVKDRMDDEDDLAVVTHAPGRGTLIPFQAFEELGLYDIDHLPHYGADYDFSFRASRSGYPVIVSYKAKVFNQVEATGLTVLQKDFSLSSLKMYLTNIKSPANISARWWLAVNNCPRLLLPSYIALDFMFVIGSYLKVHLIKKFSRAAA